MQIFGRHVLDPDGDLILMFDSRNAIVSHNNDIDLITAEDWNTMAEAEQVNDQQPLQTATNSTAYSTAFVDDTNDYEHDVDTAAVSDEKQSCCIYTTGTADITIQVVRRSRGT